MRTGLGMLAGIVLVFLGISIFFSLIFGVHFPVFRLLFAAFVVLMGVQLLFGPAGLRRMIRASMPDQSESLIFAQGEIDLVTGRGCNVLFGKARVSALGIAAGSTEPNEINVVFSDCELVLDPARAVRIRANTIFGEARLPNGNAAFLGTLVYQAAGQAPPIEIECNVIFGSLRIVNAASEPMAESVPPAVAPVQFET